MIRILLAAALALAVFCLFVIRVAYAADATTTTVDVAPLLKQVMEILVIPLLGALAVWLARKAGTWIGLQQNSAAQKTLESAMEKALAYAQGQLELHVGNKPIPIDVRSQIVATAANYAITHVPDTLKLLGVDRDKLIDKLSARLTLNTTPPELSIAVPTPPLPSAVNVSATGATS